MDVLWAWEKSLIHWQPHWTCFCHFEETLALLREAKQYGADVASLSSLSSFAEGCTTCCKVGQKTAKPFSLSLSSLVSQAINVAVKPKAGRYSGTVGPWGEGWIHRWHFNKKVLVWLESPTGRSHRCQAAHHWSEGLLIRAGKKIHLSPSDVAGS